MEENELKEGNVVTVFYLGGYNSDEHAIINIAIQPNGYTIYSEYERSFPETKTWKVERILKVGFFFLRSKEKIKTDFQALGLIPPDLIASGFSLNAAELDKICQYDKAKKHRHH